MKKCQLKEKEFEKLFEHEAHSLEGWFFFLYVSFSKYACHRQNMGDNGSKIVCYTSTFICYFVIYAALHVEVNRSRSDDFLSYVIYGASFNPFFYFFHIKALKINTHVD